MAKKKTSKRTGIQARKPLSEAGLDFLENMSCKDKADEKLAEELLSSEEASRAEMVKMVWSHIKAEGLNEGKTITLDDVLKDLTQVKKKTAQMLEVAKWVGKCFE